MNGLSWWKCVPKSLVRRRYYLNYGYGCRVILVIRFRSIKCMRCVVFLILSLVAISNVSVCVGDVSVGDIVAGYKGNASQFQKARVLYKTHTILDRQLFLPDLNIVDPTFKIDYWTNFEDVLIRGGLEMAVPFDSVLNGASDSSITTIDFESRYREIPVFSYSEQNKAVRHWFGYDTVRRWDAASNSRLTLPMPKASIGGAMPLITNSNFLFPPFLPLSYENKESVFPTDVFFEPLHENVRLLGTHEYSGEKYFVLEKRETLSGNDATHSGIVYYDWSDVIAGTEHEGSDIRMYSVCRAWIDIKRGCIPIRLEYNHYYSVDGKLLGYDDSLNFNNTSSDKVFEIQEIREIKHGLYFPMKASMKSYVMGGDAVTVIGIESVEDIMYELEQIMDTASEQPTSMPVTILDILDGRMQDTSSVGEVYMEQKWEVFHVIPDVEISREALKLPFPKGTEVYDMRTGKTSIVGLTDAEYEQMLRDEEKAILMHGVVPDSGMVFPDPDSKWTPEDFIPRPPQGREATFFVIGVNLIVLALIIRYILLSLKRRKNKK